MKPAIFKVETARRTCRTSSKGEGTVFQGSFSGQALTEYVVILAVIFAVGIGVTSVFTGSGALQDIFYDYYSSLANYLNLPFF